jgi:hypothetical protein
MRLLATAVLDGWPPARVSGRTEPGLQADSPAANALTCTFAVTRSSCSEFLGAEALQVRSDLLDYPVADRDRSS